MAKKKTRPRPTRKPKPEPMPLVLYAVKGGDGETCFGHDDFDTFDDGDVVGVYDLREVRVMAITRGLR